MKNGQVDKVSKNTTVKLIKKLNRFSETKIHFNKTHEVSVSL